MTRTLLGLVLGAGACYLLAAPLYLYVRLVEWHGGRR